MANSLIAAYFSLVFFCYIWEGETEFPGENVIVLQFDLSKASKLLLSFRLSKYVLYFAITTEIPLAGVFFSLNNIFQRLMCTRNHHFSLKVSGAPNDNIAFSPFERLAFHKDPDKLYIF